MAQLASYKGFVFATLDASAPGLEQFLGATGRLGLDLLPERGDMEVVPEIQKFVVDCNWKFAPDNLFDWHHPQVTHVSPFQTGALGGPPSPAPPNQQTEGALDMSGVQMESGADLAVPVGSITGRPFDQMVILGESVMASAGRRPPRWAIPNSAADGATILTYARSSVPSE